MNSSHNPGLKEKAQRLRREMTREERKLWYDFFNGLPVTVNRQKVIGPYIVDFYCASAKLAVELDGSQHYEASGQARDAVRYAYLRDLGLTVLRYSNTDIAQRFQAVCEDILLKLGLPLEGKLSRSD